MSHYAAAVAVVLVMGTSPLYAQNAQFTVTMASADVHKTPSTGSAVVGKAPRGTALEVVRELGSWVRVSWPQAQDGVGYVNIAWGTLSHRTAVQAPRMTEPDSPPIARSTFEPEVSAPAAQMTQTPRTSPPSPRTIPQPAPSLPSHAIGLGGRTGTRAVGFAVAARTWTHGSFAAQIEAGRSIIANASNSEQLRSMQLTPAVVYSPQNVVTNAVWARPYNIGVGINIYRSTLRSSFGFPDVVDNGLGTQLLGGAEFTWANIPQFALSADLRHQWAPDTFDGFDLNWTGFSVSAHWYVK